MPGYHISREIIAIDRVHVESVPGDFSRKIIAKHPHMIMLSERRPPFLVRDQSGVLPGDRKPVLLRYCEDGHTVGGENTMNLGESTTEVADVLKNVARYQQVIGAVGDTWHVCDVQTQVDTFMQIIRSHVCLRDWTNVSPENHLRGHMQHSLAPVHRLQTVLVKMLVSRHQEPKSHH